MNEPKQSPWPWQLREDSKQLSWDPDKVMVDANGQEMLAFYRHDPGDRIWLLDADWKIITAAPEMLEALKQAHAMIHNHDFGGAIITIEDAIAKAEGREP